MTKIYLQGYIRDNKKFSMDAKKLGKRIKLARVEMDMTQADLAQATEIMQKSISRYETGQSLPTLDTLERIAKVLKKPFGYFLDN